MSNVINYATTAAGIFITIAFIVAYRDYRAYVALGPHGLPDNLQGYIKQLKWYRIARKDITVPSPYDIDAIKHLYGPNATTSFLASSFPMRSGPRPTVPGFVAPQRQTTDRATVEMKENMQSYITHLVEVNAETLQAELSVLEGPVPALQLKADGSTHLVMSLADSKRVIENGWGERHRLSGTILGWGYTLVYAPRNEKELEVWKDIVCAAAKYSSTGIGDIQSPTPQI